VTRMSEKRSNAVPHFRIEAIEGKHLQHADSISCVIGRNLFVVPQVLGAYYCLRPLTRVMDDLVLVAGVVAFADKIVKRRHSIGWRRQLDIVAPVYDLDFWRQRHAVGLLQETLGLLTGDTWSFTFRHRRTPPPVDGQHQLKLGHGRVSVMPYSDGLDSFAMARLAAASEKGVALILVTAGRRRDADIEWRTDHLDGQRRRVSVPFRLSDKGAGYEFRESSFRSRAFVFGVMAGLAAYLSESTRVIVPESGQGTFGPWLLPVGSEAPDIHSHPIFTHRLSRFLELAIGTRIRFEHPRRWHTKGETLRALREQGLTGGWSGTHSCARRSYHVNVDGRRAHCGVCAACLLRRQSILAAGLDEADDRYVWRDLSADNLAAAVPASARSTTEDDSRHAICGALALSQLAEVGVSSRFDDIVAQAASDLAEASQEPLDILGTKFTHLIKTHRDEWAAFVRRQGPRAFLNRWTDAIAC